MVKFSSKNVDIFPATCPPKKLFLAENLVV